MAKILGALCGVGLAIALVTLAVAAEPYDLATRSAIQEVIKKQLDAFAHDDAKGAEAFATQGIREKFPEPARFFDMVKKNYAPLIRPKNIQFGNTEESPHGPLQKMIVVAPDGTVWSAIYSLQKVDGNWQISGCGLVKEEGQQAI